MVSGTVVQYKLTITKGPASNLVISNFIEHLLSVDCNAKVKLKKKRLRMAHLGK